LGRPNGANLRVTLEVEEAIQTTWWTLVRANICDLELDAGKVEFEE
jgi:hypothetical protein